MGRPTFTTATEPTVGPGSEQISDETAADVFDLVEANAHYTHAPHDTASGHWKIPLGDGSRPGVLIVHLFAQPDGYVELRLSMTAWDANLETVVEKWLDKTTNVLPAAEINGYNGPILLLALQQAMTAAGLQLTAEEGERKAVTDDLVSLIMRRADRMDGPDIRALAAELLRR